MIICLGANASKALITFWNGNKVYMTMKFNSMPLFIRILSNLLGHLPFERALVLRGSQRSGTFDAKYGRSMNKTKLSSMARRGPTHISLPTNVIFLTESKWLIVTQNSYPLLSLQSQYFIYLEIHVILWMFFAKKLNVCNHEWPFSNDENIILLAC